MFNFVVFNHPTVKSCPVVWLSSYAQLDTPQAWEVPVNKHLTASTTMPTTLQLGMEPPMNWIHALTSTNVQSTTEDVLPQLAALTSQVDMNVSAQMTMMTTNLSMELSAKEMNAPIWTKVAALTTAPTLLEDTNATAPVKCPLSEMVLHATLMNAVTTTEDAPKSASTLLLVTNVVASMLDTL